MKYSPHHAVVTQMANSLHRPWNILDSIFKYIRAVLLLTFIPTGLCAQQPGDGEWFVIPGEITTDTYRSIRIDTERAIKRGVQRIVYEFQAREPSEFGPCLDLANFLLDGIQGRIQTYAVVDGPLTGHAVLPVLACRAVYMTPQALIGFDQRALEKSGTADMTKVASYMKVGENRGRPVALLIKMLNPDLVVYRFDRDGQQFRLSKEQTDNFNLPVSDKHLLGKDDARFQPQEYMRGGMLGVYRAEEAEKLNLVNRVYASKNEIATRIGVPIGRNPLPEHPKAAVIEIAGDVTNGTYEMVQDKIRRAIKEEVNCIIFHLINTHGGPETLASASALANDMLE
ncbi:MAG TPA: hypothetical protein PKD72_10645, partial [Gemmatales bacterium]|nr:hypothetical protein [Gemmatales bacterium]